jgi:hypothetical protein
MKSSEETLLKPSSQFTKSIGSGVKSVFGNAGRKYYILEYRTPSISHRLGEQQKIIVDYIELGRDSRCVVQFDASFQTVSRRHAAITAQDGQWKLTVLSGTNPTLVNGKPVAKMWFLRDGDEIQLSYEGPRLVFRTPSNNSIKSIRLTQRLNLFRQQSLKPYKRMIILLSVILVLAVTFLSLQLWKQEAKIEEQKKQLSEMYSKAQKVEGNVDSLEKRIANDEKSRKALDRKLKNLEKIIRDAKKQAENGPVQGPGNKAGSEFAPLFPFVYFIQVDKIVVIYNQTSKEITDYSWKGSGFLLSDGRFVTARHVIEPWYFLNQSDPDFFTLVSLNNIISGGGSVTTYFTAYSPDGSKFTFKSDDFRINRSTDEVLQTTDIDGNAVLLKIAKGSLDGTDCAYYQSGKKGGLEFSDTFSENLHMQDILYILGYPLGLGAENTTNISPIYGDCTVSADGLQGGVIYVTNRNFEHGNSGGPVFYQKEGIKYVVAIVSAAAGESTGFLVPISALNRIRK